MSVVIITDNTAGPVLFSVMCYLPCIGILLDYSAAFSNILVYAVKVKPIVIPSTGIMKVFDKLVKHYKLRKCKQHNCICLGEYGLNYLEENGDMNVSYEQSYEKLYDRYKCGNNISKHGTMMINLYKDVCEHEDCSACVMFGTLFLFYDFSPDQVANLRVLINSDFDKYVCGKSWIAIRN